MATLKELNEKIDDLAATLKAAGADVRTVSQGGDYSALVESMEQKIDSMFNAFVGERAKASQPNGPAPTAAELSAWGLAHPGQTYPVGQPYNQNADPNFK